ncbi:MAG: NADH:ubiquinone oxidoreductase subunit RnfE [Oscillospiraceae bacterium]|nr:NADH:ubiquinone oxidoreductase subunit RnfE [Oscillospiraceae bacterium]
MNESEKKSKINLDGLFRQNIVLMSGLVTAPIIVAATTAERALVLTLSFFMVSYISILVCRLIPRKIMYSMRILIYAVAAAAVYIPTVLLLSMLFPETVSGVLIYIEISVVNLLLLAKTESRFYLESFGTMAVDALVYIAGYAVAAFAVGIIRELLAYGTIFGLFLFDEPMPAARSPFFGFILVGILAAVCRVIVGRRGARK